MSNSNITLFEYVTYNLIQAKKDYYHENLKTLYLTEKTLNELEKINKNNKFLDIRRKTIKPLNYVGVVKTGNFTIEVLPKLFKNEYEKHRGVVAGNLLKMLSYCEKLSPKEIDFADLHTEKFNFFEIFIYFFAKNLNELLKSTQRREYIKKSEELRFIKGRIDIKNYTNPARLHIIPCNYYNLSIDTPLNQTLKYTCYLMSRMVKNTDTFRKLKSISGILNDVTLCPVSLEEIDRISFTRLNRKFKPFIKICRIFLSHSTLTLQASNVETFSLLIPMEKLFEQFIAEVLKEDPEYFFGKQTSISSQAYIGELAHSEDNSSIFNLRPDIVVKRDLEVSIIDTKYKLLDNKNRKSGVSQADMYQMYAYITKKDANSSMLLYPDTELRQQMTFFYCVKNKEEKRVPLFISSIKLSYDLTNEKEWFEFRKSLKSVFMKLFN